MWYKGAVSGVSSFPNILSLLHCVLLYVCRLHAGYGKPTAHAHVMMFDALPVGRTACMTMESLRTFVFA